VFDGDEDGVEEHKNDDEPVERLTLDEMPQSYSAPDTNDDFSHHCNLTRQCH